MITVLPPCVGYDSIEGKVTRQGLITPIRVANRRPYTRKFSGGTCLLWAFARVASGGCMATKTPVECPLCHDELTRGQNLEDHLVETHSKQTLAKFVVAETEALGEEDVSE